MTKKMAVQQIVIERLTYSNPRDNTDIPDFLFETLQTKLFSFQHHHQLYHRRQPSRQTIKHFIVNL